MSGLILIGCGEHARVLVDACGAASLAGYIDRGAGEPSLPYLGTDDAFLAGLAPADPRRFVLGVGAVRPSALREALAARYEAAGASFGTIVHPRALVASSATVAPGAVVLAGAIVNPGAKIGRHVIVNTGAIIEHDVVLGDHAIVAPGAVIGGGTVVEAGAFIGLGARVRDHVIVGDHALVAMGAVVVGPVPRAAVVAGVPARPLR